MRKCLFRISIDKIMEEKTKDRVRLLLKKNNLSFNAISDTSAIQSQFSRAFGKGKSGRLSYELIEIVLRKFPDVSAEWLLLGEGDMYKKTTELPPVDISSEESIEHSAEIARLVREKNELIEKIEDLQAKCAKLEELTDALSKENIAIAAQRDMAKDLLREYMMGDSAQKVG